MIYLTYEQLLTTTDQAGLTVKEHPLQKHDGLIRGNRIAIRKSIDTQAEKSCVLAEELVYDFENESGTGLYSFDDEIPVCVYPDLSIKNSELL